MGTAKCVAAEIAELTVLASIRAVARASAGVHCRYKGIGIEPLDCAGLRDAGNGFVFIEWHTGNAVAICGIGSAQDRKRNAAVPKDSS